MMFCGGCRRELAVGAPVLELRIGARITLYRGECCVGHAPPELPALIKRAEIVPFVATRFTRDMLPLDWRQKSSGEREPGEEG